MNDERFMRMALAEAKRGVGRTSPNPAVGAVIVKGGRILGRGFHRRAGESHAEIEALNALTRPASSQGATLYVTLEPCSTRGRTGACVEAIIEAGFARVVIGTADPNPAHAGRAKSLLETAGIAVTQGVLEAQCREINKPFNKWITTGLPYVVAKMAVTLDGRLTRPPAESRWLTGFASRREVHALRAQVDAILVGGATVRTDNPRLTVRNVRGATQPWRVVVSRSGRLPASARLLTDTLKARTLVYRKLALKPVLLDLGRREITSVLIEGGMRVLGEAFDARLVDAVQLYIAPWVCGGPVLAIGGRGEGSPVLVNPVYQRIEEDVRITAEVAYRGES